MSKSSKLVGGLASTFSKKDAIFLSYSRGSFSIDFAIVSLLKLNWNLMLAISFYDSPSSS